MHELDYTSLSTCNGNQSITASENKVNCLSTKIGAGKYYCTMIESFNINDKDMELDNIKVCIHINVEILSMIKQAINIILQDFSLIKL